jgi:1-acyl-sn-glycerol-3-phosphate acyltransferase
VIAPTAIRRPVTVTVWLVVSALAVIASPFLLAAGAVASRLTGRRQPLIAARVILAYFSYELGGLIRCGALWLAAGGGHLIGTSRFQRLHWRLLEWFIAGLAAEGRDALSIDVRADPTADAARALDSDRPVLVFSRHAGPGDTIFIIDELMSRYDRRPSVVFKEAIALDPCVDLLAHRLPHAMLDTSDREECEARIERVTRALAPRGALLLFPEGGNFTPSRRRSAVARLRRKGRGRSAQRAEEMPRVLPPQPTGSLAALAARGNADVLFAAHTGLGLAAYPRQWWRDMPIGRTLHTRMWLVPSDEVPPDTDDQVEWLYDWWKRIDRWIDAQGTEPETEREAADR